MPFAQDLGYLFVVDFNRNTENCLKLPPHCRCDGGSFFRNVPLIVFCQTYDVLYILWLATTSDKLQIQ